MQIKIFFYNYGQWNYFNKKNKKTTTKISKDQVQFHV